MMATPSAIIVDSTLSVQTLVDDITTMSASPAYLYLDLEGIDLGRHGTISILTLFLEPLNKVYLVDVHTLQSSAFTTSGTTTADTTNLQSILESPELIKVLFDLRNDSDALHAHFGIRLRGVQDVQLLENASRRSGSRRLLSGLERCIVQDAPLSGPDKVAWQAAKNAGAELFRPARGGSFDVFNRRPIPPAIERYCINDVVLLAPLRRVYWGRLSAAWRQKVVDESEKRVRESQSPGYNPGRSPDKALGPWQGSSSQIPGRLYWEDD